MKLMKKRAVLLTLMATSAGLLASCGSETKCEDRENASFIDVEKITPTEPTEKVTIDWWNNYQEPDSTKTDEENRNNSNYKEYYYAKDLIDAFSKEHPNIEVVQSYKGSYSDIVTATSNALATGDQPNIVSCYGDSVAVFRKANEDAVLNMTGYAKNLTEDSDFNQNYLNIEKGMYTTGYYSLPYSKSAETLVVNQSMFDLVGEGSAGATTTTVKDGVTTNVYTAPVAISSKTKYNIPENIYELVDVARKIKADFPTLFANQKDSDGYFTAVPFCWDSSENMFISALQNSGIKYTDGLKTTAACRVLFKNDDAKRLMVQLKKWNNEGLFCTQNQLPITNAANQKHQYSSNMLVAGSIAMCVSSTAGARYFATDGGFKASFNHTVSWDEDGKAKDAKVISQGPSLCFFDKGKTANDAAFIFYQYLTNAKNSGNLASKTSYFPLRNKGYEVDSIKTAMEKSETGVDASASYSDKNSAYTGDVLSLNKTYTSENAYFLSPVFEESSATRTAIGNLVTEVFNGTASTDADIEKLVNDAFDNAYAKVLG